MSAPQPIPASRLLTGSSGVNSKELVKSNTANEIVFAVVGPAGSGPSFVSQRLRAILDRALYKTTILKATTIISEPQMLDGYRTDSIKRAEDMQRRGDALRKEDPTAIAREFALLVRRARAEQMNLPDIGHHPVKPDAERRAYILDSLKHPAEVELLRRVYQHSFVLIGIVCDRETRLNRLTRKFSDAGRTLAESFMRADENSKHSHGQQVADTFHLADVFVDNSIDERLLDGEVNNACTVGTALDRIVKIVSHTEIVRPFPSETAMHAAYAAQTQSACLSRQVGAALIDKHGNLISTGTNEVPRAGGGVYGEYTSETDGQDHRCAFKNGYCSSTREQLGIIDKIVESLTRHGVTVGDSSIREILLDSPVTQLLEFSRAVHAEMDALIGAARTGHSTVGARLFVTTYPCHYCARHIVAAGVDEVQYIEPYSKSRAGTLHSDSITADSTGWHPPSDSNGERTKVLFRPFVGVAPRLYRQAFSKDRKLKDAKGLMVSSHPPDWGSPWQVLSISYAELEATLLRSAESQQSATLASIAPKPPARAVVHELPRAFAKKETKDE